MKDKDNEDNGKTTQLRALTNYYEEKETSFMPSKAGSVRYARLLNAPWLPPARGRFASISAGLLLRNMTAAAQARKEHGRSAEGVRKKTQAAVGDFYGLREPPAARLLSEPRRAFFS